MPFSSSMYTDMMDISSQLMLKWERFGPQHVLEVSQDFTRLAFDTIALCAMGHRLNSFYTPAVPPFVQAMGDFLAECYVRPLRLVPALHPAANAKWEADADKMMGLCAESEWRVRAAGRVADAAPAVVAARKAAGSDRNDLLDRMLHGRDPKTGEGLSDENIMYQLITFLIAGLHSGAAPTESCD
jgi:cytochrome P450/NADPH-cytochrome P450 reductase